MKKELTPEQTYNKNKKRAKALAICSPIVFWGFIALAVICLIIALKNSFGNIAEICELLDDKKFTGEQIADNYAFLIDKYGEWIIGTGGSGFTITFINIGKAVFSGMMILCLVMSVVFLVGAFVLGKWLFPMLSKSITQNNQDMVNLTVLKGQKKE